MRTAELLPYVTSLGLLFVLIGFATLVWTRSYSRKFPFVALFCFALGIGLAGGSLYAETFYEALDMAHQPIHVSAQQRTEIRICEDAAKTRYLQALHKADISCTTDSTGWPNIACVTRSDAGARIYEQLHFDDNVCFERTRPQ